MKIIEMDILNSLATGSYQGQRELAERTGYSLGKVNQSLASLQEQGYLTEEYHLTGQAQQEIREKSPKNAVILAAGFGLRMMPINQEVPKGLLEVHGEPLIERQIRQLQEAGIRDITVVVGFMKESYEYLMDRYGVQLKVNRDYALKNNLYSLELVKNRLGNTYIIPCDIWCEDNPFSSRELYSWYMVSDLVDDESGFRVNRKLELVETEPEKGGNAMIGIAYLTEEDAAWVRARMEELCPKKSSAGYFWEEALMDGKKMRICARMVPSPSVFEINTYEQLKELDEESRNLKSELLEMVAGVLGCGQEEILDIRVLKKGMTNRSFRFTCRGRDYIMRIPGEGTDQLINRKQEYQVYQAINGEGISDAIHYFDPENGYKVTEYLEGSHCCDPENWEEVDQCMAFLRKFHQKDLAVEHTFDIFERIDFYQKLWNGQASCYRDYQETLEGVQRLRPYIDSQPKRWTLCHIDAVPDNFLIREMPEGTDIHLIDWEYSGMQDADVDIAMFAIYALYEKEQVDRLIDGYYPEGISREHRLKIYCYVAACGLLWSNWCEFKRQQGVEFGEYSLRQYRYAKEFARYVEKDTSMAIRPGIRKGEIEI